MRRGQRGRGGKEEGGRGREEGVKEVRREERGKEGRKERNGSRKRGEGLGGELRRRWREEEDREEGGKECRQGERDAPTDPNRRLRPQQRRLRPQPTKPPDASDPKLPRLQGSNPPDVSDPNPDASDPNPPSSQMPQTPTYHGSKAPSLQGAGGKGEAL